MHGPRAEGERGLGQVRAPSPRRRTGAATSAPTPGRSGPAAEGAARDARSDSGTECAPRTIPGDKDGSTQQVRREEQAHRGGATLRAGHAFSEMGTAPGEKGRRNQQIHGDEGEKPAAEAH